MTQEGNTGLIWEHRLALWLPRSPLVGAFLIAVCLSAAYLSFQWFFDFPVHRVAGEQRVRLRNGGDLPAGDLHRAVPGTRVSILDGAGEFLAVAEVRADRRLWPLRVLPFEPT